MLKNGSKLHLSKIMGSVELLKSYISLRKFKKLITFFFEIFEKFDISCGFWVSDKYNSIDYKLLQR